MNIDKYTDRLTESITDNAKDLITDSDLEAVKLANEARISNITNRYDPETLRRQFDNKKTFSQSDHHRKTEGTVPGVYKAHEVQQLPILDIDNAKRAFWMIYSTVIKTQPKLTTNNKLVLEEIMYWMIGEGPLKTNKGLYIFGEYGRGKSDLITALYLFSLKAKNRYSNVKQLPLAKEYKFLYEKAEKGMSIKGLYMVDKSVTIDDIGFKGEAQLNIFGNKKDLVTNIIYTRHSIWKRDNKHTTIFTSNLFPEDIEATQGEGVSSRLKEMCNVLLWDGEVNFREL